MGGIGLSCIATSTEHPSHIRTHTQIQDTHNTHIYPCTTIFTCIEKTICSTRQHRYRTQFSHNPHTERTHTTQRTEHKQNNMQHTEDNREQDTEQHTENNTEHTIQNTEHSTQNTCTQLSYI